MPVSSGACSPKPAGDGRLSNAPKAVALRVQPFLLPVHRTEAGMILASTVGTTGARWGERFTSMTLGRAISAIVHATEALKNQRAASSGSSALRLQVGA